jgi:hypothetical protein
MIHKADHIKDIVIQDPDTGSDVDVSIFKHQNGGIFGMDSSYLEQAAQECSSGNPVVPDPFGDIEDEVNDLVLEYPET